MPLNAMVLAPCEFQLDPRHGYWSESLRKMGYNTLEVEIVARPTHWRNGTERLIKDGRISLFLRGQRPSVSDWSKFVEELPAQTTTGIYLKRGLLDTVAATELVRKEIQSSNVIIANDLAGAVAVLSASKSSSASIIYDAQEIFTDSYDLLPGEPLSVAERAAWIALETQVVKCVNHVVTVSPGIASLYEHRHGRRPEVIPNFVPEDRYYFKPMFDRSARGATKFVFIGRGDPYRGLEQLVDVWDFDPTVATLDLILPSSYFVNSLKRRASRAKRKFSGPKFVPPVPPETMIQTLSSYDVGVLPYRYPAPYDQASPNKLGEYIAAGLPIVANEQPFISNVIQGGGIGCVFDWDKEGSFKEAIESICEDPMLSKVTTNVLSDRALKFNWDVNFIGFFSKVKEDLQRLQSTDFDNLTPDDTIALRDSLTIAIRFALRNRAITWVRNHLGLVGPIVRIVGRVKRVRHALSRPRQAA
jgi:glycosyltransferase involved in cell wall biosynthesis